VHLELWYLINGLAVILVIVLLAPISFDIRGGYFQELHLQGRICWAGGLAGLEVVHSQGKTDVVLGLLCLKIPVSSDKSKTKTRKKTKSHKQHAKSAPHFSTIINRRTFSAVKASVNKLKRAMHLDIDVSGTYGFDDPSLTGNVMAILSAFLWNCNTINLCPDFTGTAADIEGKARGYFIPLHIGIIIVLFLLARPIRDIWWPMIRRPKKRKEAVQYA